MEGGKDDICTTVLTVVFRMYRSCDTGSNINSTFSRPQNIIKPGTVIPREAWPRFLQRISNPEKNGRTFRYKCYTDCNNTGVS